MSIIKSRKTSFIMHIYFILGIVNNSDNKILVGISYLMLKDA